jgi:hypothetical protein
MFGYTMKTTCMNLAIFYFFSLSHLGTENMRKHIFFLLLFIFVFSFHFLAIYVQHAKAGDITADSN